MSEIPGGLMLNSVHTVSVCSLILLAITGIFFIPSSAESVPVNFMPAIFVEDYGGTSRVINNYTIEVDSDVTMASWNMLGSDDQQTFELIDSRKGVSFTSGVQKQFNLSNTDAYRYYFVYLVGGFTAGNNIEIHFDEAAPASSPKEDFTPYFNFTTKRTLHVVMFDFRKSGIGAIQNYTITTDETLADSQTWYLFGTNSSEVLGSSNAGLFTQVDYQHDVGFTAGVTKSFDISVEPVFQTYVIYIDGGFYVTGTNVEVRFNSVPPAPPVLPSAAFSCTPTGGDIPLDVTCIDSSSGSPISWNWSFGDGYVSDLQNPSHTYDTAGTFDVNLTVCNGDGCDTELKLGYITATTPVPAFEADFTANVTSATDPPLAVQFTINTTNVSVIDDYYWEFGDGNLDIAPNPVNVYTNRGWYDVHFRIRNVSEIKEYWRNKTAYIRISVPPETIPAYEYPLTPSTGPVTTIPDTVMGLNFLVSLGLMLYSTQKRDDENYLHIMMAGVAVILAVVGGFFLFYGGVGNPQTISVSSYVERVVIAGENITQEQRTAFVSSSPSASEMNDPTFAMIYWLLAVIGGVLVIYYIIDALEMRKIRKQQDLEDMYG